MSSCVFDIKSSSFSLNFDFLTGLLTLQNSTQQGHHITSVAVSDFKNYKTSTLDLELCPKTSEIKV